MAQSQIVITELSPSLHIYQLDPPGSAVVDKVKNLFEDGDRTPARPDASSPAAEWMMRDSFAIRREVFTVEQHCDWALEVNADDARSWHFSAYEPWTGGPADADAATTTAAASSQSHPTTNGDSSFSNGDDGATTSPPTTATAATNTDVTRAAAHAATPLATIRLVPGPHATHPAPGSRDEVGGEWPAGTVWETGHRDVRTGWHDGRERYVKLGRLVTVKAARGRGLASALIGTALDWAARNPEKLDAASSGGRGGEESSGGDNGDTVEREQEKNEGEEDEDERGVGKTWMGLVLVHAQRDVAPMYARNGFVEDKGLGSWFEEDIPHIGMWKRVKIPGRS